MPYNIQKDFIDPANRVIQEYNQNNSTKMTKKLFYVEITKSGFVLADDEAEAGTFGESILDTEYLSEVKVSEYDENLLKSSGWDKDCYIYHKNMRSKDIKLGEVL